MRVRRLAAWTALPLAVTAGPGGLRRGGDGGSGGGPQSRRRADRDRRAAAPGARPTPTRRAAPRCSPRLFSPLVDYDEANKPYEVAAESITSTDNKVWTVKLKDGYTFHNGEKVTADNYINAWNYGAYGPNGQDNNYFFEQIEGYADLNRPTPTATGREGAEPKAKTLTGLKKVDDLTFTVDAGRAVQRVQDDARLHRVLPAAQRRVLRPRRAQGGLTSRRRSATGPFKMKGTWQHDAKIEVERTTRTRAPSRRSPASSSGSTSSRPRRTRTCWRTTST